MTYADFVSIYRDFAKPCNLLRFAPSWGDKPAHLCQGLVLLTGKEKERVDSGIETSRTTTVAYFATLDTKVNPVVGDIVECLDGSCYRIEEVSSIDIYRQVYELTVMQFQYTDR